MLVLVSVKATLGIQQSLIGFDQGRCLFGKLQGHELKGCGFHFSKNNRFGRLIPTGIQFAINHHFRNHAVNFILAHGKHGAQLRQRKRVVLRRERKQIRAKTFQFDFGRQHGFNLFRNIVFAGNQLPHVQLGAKIGTRLPVSLHQGLGGTHDKITSLLRRSRKDLWMDVQRAKQKIAGERYQS